MLSEARPNPEQANSEKLALLTNLLKKILKVGRVYTSETLMKELKFNTSEELKNFLLNCPAETAVWQPIADGADWRLVESSHADTKAKAFGYSKKYLKKQV